MLGWLEDHQALLWTLSALSVLLFVATLILTPLLIARLPADYFTRRPPERSPARRLVSHRLLVIGKNAAGVVLVLAGLSMLVLPGQGLLTILVGILLVDFPGKRRLQRWLIRRRPLSRTANWIRARRHRPPLELPGADFKERASRSGSDRGGRRHRPGQSQPTEPMI